MQIEDIINERIEKKSLDLEQLMKIIPHREPMLLIDSIVDHEPGEWAVGYKSVKVDDTFLKGHFPGKPLLPGSLQIEALSQVCVLIMLTQNGCMNNAGILAEVKNARFFEPILPSYDIKFYAVKLRERMGIWKFTGLAKMGDITCMTADMTLTLANIE